MSKSVTHKFEFPDGKKKISAIAKLKLEGVSFNWSVENISAGGKEKLTKSDRERMEAYLREFESPAIARRFMAFFPDDVLAAD